MPFCSSPKNSEVNMAKVKKEVEYNAVLKDDLDDINVEKADL